MHILFRWFSPDVTNTWALQGDVLGSMTPSRRPFWIFSSINSRFTADWRLDFVTTGVQSVVQCAKSLGVIFVLTLFSTPRESGGLLPPKFILTSSCCRRMSCPRITSVSKFSRTTSFTLRSSRSFKQMSAVQNPLLQDMLPFTASPISLLSGIIRNWFLSAKFLLTWLRLEPVSMRALAHTPFTVTEMFNLCKIQAFKVEFIKTDIPSLGAEYQWLYYGNGTLWRSAQSSHT